MFKFLETFLQTGIGRAPTIRLGDDAYSHVVDWMDHQAELEHRAEYAERVARCEATAAAWAKLSDDERDAVIRWCDDLNAQGRLEDHRFFDQWVALRMQGYVGD
ncbi:hypothetical protein PMI01_00032 [Caulobacter sp. AP07]|uniref:hypothetical protein n=1 Tax=Caulobacter sp. AP07 TaxID=1144304 RepID=UPI000271E334|nr:hypothetical protein [Caulobacter sp. AP07]EJL38465.1 hypothetical protein PMI01_00032 [Caulobacter sp. AP07]